MPPIVSVVTPSFNSVDFLALTLDSVIGQPGNFQLHYHIQDGGSTDGTVELVQERIARLSAGERVHCAGVKLTLSVEPDRGMYDAINRGFAALPVGESALMTWINSDDLLAPGAVHSALSIIQSLPDVTWLGGRMSQIDALGSIIRVHPPFVYSSVTLQEGKCDGREGRFIQQEGVFWRPQLWSAVNGLDASFKLAGDWDLWRRFAKFADYSLVDSVLGFHRRRTGQLSADLTPYYLEVDAKKKEIGSIQDLRRTRSAPQYILYGYQTRSWITPQPPQEALAGFVPPKTVQVQNIADPVSKVQGRGGFLEKWRARRKRDSRKAN